MTKIDSLKAQKTITDKVIDAFALAIKEKDLIQIESLLEENGQFQISAPNNERISVSAKEYIVYLSELIKVANITDYSFDQCLYCNAGGRVILFNEGRFPFNNIMNNDHREKTGFMLRVENEKIKEIKFCHSFLKNENRPQFEVNADKIKQLMNDNGWDFDRAYDFVFKVRKPAK